jgi:NADPH:quinone reductase-like Zn-dependent oxidoreductase
LPLAVRHSDSVTVQGLMPGTTYPRVPGHEVIGMVEAIGADVPGWDVGMRVGVSVGSVVRAGYLRMLMQNNDRAVITSLSRAWSNRSTRWAEQFGR